MTMDPGEALGTAAQVAITIAGFAGVVVVFSSRAAHEWSPVDKFRLRLLLTFSVLPLALSMAGLLLATAPLAPPVTWRWCSAIAFLFLLVAALAVSRAFARFSSAELKAAGASRAVFYPGASLGIAITLLQLYNFALLHVFWPFFAAIVMAILASSLQFMRLILNRRE